MSYFIRGAQVVGVSRVTRCDLRIEGDRIVAMGKLKRPAGATLLDGRGLYALPGFIDLHTHGALDFNAINGLYAAKTGKSDASPEVFRSCLPKIMKFFARAGCTTTLLASGGEPVEQLKHAYAQMADYLEGPGNGRDGARLEGFFVEGTFIKNPACAGAQNPENFEAPSVRLFQSLQRSARGHIRYVNITPEFGGAAERLISHLTRNGVLAGMGHTSCGADQVARCAKLGMKVSIHFLNGPTGSSYKPFHGGNVVEAVLSNRDLYVELICDGWHVNPRYVLDVIKRKGIDRVVMVTDSTFVSRNTRIKSFVLGGIRGKVHQSGEYLQVVGTQDTLFGSVLTPERGFGNLLSWLTSALDGVWTGKRKPMGLNRALVHAARACATNPARLLGLDKTRGAGALARGKCADLMLARVEGRPGKHRLKVKHTFVGGRKVV